MSNVNTFVVPKANGFTELERDKLNEIKEEAWSVENMPGHDAANLATKYIGSSFGEPVPTKDGEAMKIFDYFLDSSGGYWYGVRVLLPSGKLISMEEFLFGVRDRKRSKRIKEGENDEKKSVRYGNWKKRKK